LQGLDLGFIWFSSFAQLSLNRGMLVLPKQGRLENFNSAFTEVSSKEARFHTAKYGREVF